MRHFLKNWLIPPGVFNLRNGIIKFRTNNNIDLKANRELYQKYKDVKRCYILATGPSIKDEKLELLKDEFCISVSNFFVHDLYASLKPKFHLFAPSHHPITTEQFSGWLKDAADATNFDTNFVISASDKEIAQQTPDFLPFSRYYYKQGGEFPIAFDKQIPQIRTVVHAAIYLALFLGIKEINLLGVDHSWMQHPGKGVHFYKEDKNKLVALNYNEWKHKDIGTLFEGYGKTWKIYREILSYAQANGFEIYNLTQDSLLDIFPKKTLLDSLNNEL